MLTAEYLVPTELIPFVKMRDVIRITYCSMSMSIKNSLKMHCLKKPINCK